MHRTNKLVCIALFMASIPACNYKSDIPIEFPTPPPTAVATPLANQELKRDEQLEAQFTKLAEESRGKVGAAAVVIETGEAALLNADQRFPMQSVYKLPISMAVMDQVRLDKLDLDEKIGVTKEDMVREGMRSPLRDANPNGGEFTIRELIRLALVESDGTASDVLMRVAGDAPEIRSFLDQIGIENMRVVNSEKEMGRAWAIQYDNWSTPLASVELLRWLQASCDSTPDAENSRAAFQGSGEDLQGCALIMRFMADSIPGAMRLKRLLPKGTAVAHKTGTSGTQNNITAATNDIGIITLPNGKRLVVAVFVSDSAVDEKTREAVIAKIAKAAFDRWSN